MNIKVTFRQKYKKIIQNKDRFSSTDLKLISDLSSFQNSEEDFEEPSTKNILDYARTVRLQTFYKICMPGYYQLIWDEEITTKVLYPIVAIVAFKSKNEHYYHIKSKFCLWVESGGTRTVPLKSSSSHSQIKQMIQNTHGMVIPDNESDIDQSFLFNLAEILKEKESQRYPVLAVGNSAMALTSYLRGEEIKAQKKRLLSLQKGIGGQVLAFASHQQKAFRDLDVRTRIQVENKGRVWINYSYPVSVFNESGSEDMKALGICRSRNDEWLILGCRSLRQQLFIWCLFFEPSECLGREGINFAHKAIVNFLDELRSIGKKVQQKYTQTEQYKLCLEEDCQYYNIDIKNPK